MSVTAARLSVTLFPLFATLLVLDFDLERLEFFLESFVAPPEMLGYLRVSKPSFYSFFLEVFSNFKFAPFLNLMFLLLPLFRSSF
jgi:hypothetical protein